MVAVAFVDFRKAFDCVSHDTLEMKLKRDCSITAHSLIGVIRSYLDGRQQITVVNGLKSHLLPVSFGISQRSVLLSHYSQTTFHLLSAQDHCICMQTILQSFVEEKLKTQLLHN